MNTFPETIDSLVPRNVRAYLAADSTLAAFFGTSAIRAYDSREKSGPKPAPWLSVIPGELPEKLLVSGRAEADYPIEIEARLPRLTPADDALAVPSAPSAVAGATGLLSVTRRYGVTSYTATGESFCSNLSSPVTVTAKRITVVIPTGPTGTVGRRLWATKSGRICAFLLDIVADNTTTSYTDETPDALLGDEIAPDPMGYRKLFGYVKKLMAAEDTLQDIVKGTGYAQADNILQTVDLKPTIDAERNQLVWSIVCRFHLYYDRLTRDTSIEP